jgi:hypothetical protein
VKLDRAPTIVARIISVAIIGLFLSFSKSAFGSFIRVVFKLMKFWGSVAEVNGTMRFVTTSTTNLEINEWVKESQFVYF